MNWHRLTLRAAIDVCNQIADEWGRETKLRIKGLEGDNDDWGEASAKEQAARQCATALRAMLR